jgi:hypothetical protein
VREVVGVSRLHIHGPTAVVVIRVHLACGVRENVAALPELAKNRSGSSSIQDLTKISTDECTILRSIADEDKWVTSSNEICGKVLVQSGTQHL